MAPRRIPEPVAEIDIAPTIAEVLGFPREPEHDGDSLLATARDETPPARPYVISEIIPEFNDHSWLFSIIDARWQLVADDEIAGRALHDLARDPYGVRDCVVEHAAARAALEHQLRSISRSRHRRSNGYRALGTQSPTRAVPQPIADEVASVKPAAGSSVPKPCDAHSRAEGGSATRR